MRAKNAAVSVHFIDHHQAETLEKRLPNGVVGQNALVQHILAAQQLQELAAGFGGLRMIATVTVYGNDAAHLLAAEQDLLHAASAINVEVRRMTFNQSTGFNTTALPLGLAFTRS